MERVEEVVGETTSAVPVKLFCGMIAGEPDVMRLAKDRLSRLYGEIDLESESVPFDFTDYYRDEMGAPLVRKFLSFRNLMDPGRLAEVKIQTNTLEQEFAAMTGARRRRRINLDPGYLDAAKLVLATTKNFAHRIYLGQGIYAEVTLIFRKAGVGFFDWTYPDYRSESYTRFFLDVRRRYLSQRSDG
jgi:hypothetical protein